MVRFLTLRVLDLGISGFLQESRLREKTISLFCQLTEEKSSRLSYTGKTHLMRKSQFPNQYWLEKQQF